MANQLVTNELTDLVALKFLVNAAFLTVGSKEHFKDQMIGKRNGQTYTFVLRDAAPVYEGGVDATVGNVDGSPLNPDKVKIVDGTNLKNVIQEREIKMTLRDFAQFQDTNLIEPITDMESWDKQVATPNGAAMAQKIVMRAIDEAIPAASVAIKGEGWQPLAEVSAHLASISGDKMYGFIDPKIQAILASNGQQFQPVGAPDMYKKGLLGTFHEVEYRGQRFLPSIIFDLDMTGAKVANVNDTCFQFNTTSEKAELTLVLAAGNAGKTIKKGTPFFINGIYASDFVGYPTAEQFAFICSKDTTVPAASGSPSVCTVSVPVLPLIKSSTEFAKLFGSKTTVSGKTITKGLGARSVCKEDGDVVVVNTDIKGADVTSLDAGTYWMAQVRVDGTYEFTTLDKLDSNNAESKFGAIEGTAVKVHENRVVDNNTLTNTTRWDVVTMFGTIEPRGVANVYIKKPS